MKLKPKFKNKYTLNPIIKFGSLIIFVIFISVFLINIFGVPVQNKNLISDNEILRNSITPTLINLISESITPSNSVTPTNTIAPTNTPKPTNTIKPTNTKTPTPTFVLSPGQVGPNCPAVTSSCVPCNTSDSLCRFEPGKTTGFRGCSCQNNNPGNIRPAAFKNTMIVNNGGTAPCGQRTMNNPSGGQGDYMVFRTFSEGKNALKAYVKGIALGQHSSYVMPSVDFNCGECSLKQFFFKYAGGTLAAQDSPTSYSNNVANWIGVNADTTTLNWIVANKLDQFADAIQRQEGWYVN